MADAPNPQIPSQSSPQPVFGSAAARPSERSFPTAAVAIASAAILILAAVLIALGRKHGAPDPYAIQPLAAYAANLQVSDIAMSESTSVANLKSTFIDGKITNRGQQTVTGITAQTLFRNDEAMAPQVMTEPLSLIRTREPYVDTQPVSADPLKPGDTREFRLIYEGVNANWNQQLPEIHITAVQTR